MSKCTDSSQAELTGVFVMVSWGQRDPSIRFPYLSVSWHEHPTPSPPTDHPLERPSASLALLMMSSFSVTSEAFTYSTKVWDPIWSVSYRTVSVRPGRLLFLQRTFSSCLHHVQCCGERQEVCELLFSIPMAHWAHRKKWSHHLERLVGRTSIDI